MHILFRAAIGLLTGTALVGGGYLLYKKFSDSEETPAEDVVNPAPETKATETTETNEPEVAATDATSFEDIVEELTETLVAESDVTTETAEETVVTPVPEAEATEDSVADKGDEAPESETFNEVIDKLKEGIEKENKLMSEFITNWEELEPTKEKKLSSKDKKKRKKEMKKEQSEKVIEVDLPTEVVDDTPIDGGEVKDWLESEKK